MINAMNTAGFSPIRPKERYIILDALRGLALFGICLANFPEFSLYSFLKSDVATGMPTARDRPCNPVSAIQMEWIWRMLTYGKWFKLLK